MVKKDKAEEAETKEVILKEDTAERLAQYMGFAIKEGVKGILQEVSRPVVIKIKGSEDVKIDGDTHCQFAEVLQTMSAKCNPFLVGPAGSGKTHTIEQAAKVLGLRFFCISVCAQTTASVLLGYMDAGGHYVRTNFREAYENGGVFLLDELDNGNPNVLSVLNSAIANSVCAFPDGMITKHSDFVLCASGNTYGTGADRKYVGRLEIDAATLDRFVIIDFGYDKKLETKLCRNSDISAYVQALRSEAERLNMRHIISPRASINLSRLLPAGVPLSKAVDMCIFKGMNNNDRSKLNTSDIMKLYKNLENSIKQPKKDEVVAVMPEIIEAEGAAAVVQAIVKDL